MNRGNEELLFRKLIKRYLMSYFHFSAESIQFGLDEDCLVVVVSGKKMVITLGYGIKWENLKRRIDKMMMFSEGEDNNECHICEDFDSKVNNSQISCPKCANTYCRYCYIEMFKKNKGLIICPFCRNQCGTHMSEKRIAEYIYGLENLEI